LSENDRAPSPIGYDSHAETLSGRGGDCDEIVIVNDKNPGMVFQYLRQFLHRARMENPADIRGKSDVDVVRIIIAIRAERRSVLFRGGVADQRGWPVVFFICPVHQLPPRSTETVGERRFCQLDPGYQGCLVSK
jgi:hypothetical protein